METWQIDDTFDDFDKRKKNKTYDFDVNTIDEAYCIFYEYWNKLSSVRQNNYINGDARIIMQKLPDKKEVITIKQLLFEILYDRYRGALY